MNDRPRGTAGSSRESLAFPLLLYGAAVCALFAPVILHMGSLVPGSTFIAGHYGNTIFYHLDPAKGLGIPLHSMMQGWPDGGWCIFNAWPNILFIALARHLLPLPIAFNLSLLLSFLIAPLGMFALARRLGMARAGALTAGLVYGFCPMILAAVDNGQIEQLHHGWIPLCLLFFFRISKGEGGAGSYVALALTWLAACMSNAYYAFFILLFMLIILAFSVGKSRPASGALLPMLLALVVGKSRPASGALLPMLLALAVVGACSILPARYYSLLREYPADSLLHCPSGIKDLPDLAPGHVVKIGSSLPFVDPKNLVAPRSPSHGLHNVYVGYSVLLLVIAGLIAGRRRGTALWIFALLFFLALSLGPALVVNGAIVTVAGHPVPMPFLLLQKLFGDSFVFSMAYRFLLGATLAAAVVAGFEVDALARRAGGYAPALGNLVNLAILVDFFLVPALPFPVQTTSIEAPAFYEALRREPGDFAIVELPDSVFDPGRPGERFNSQYYALYQATHGKKLGNAPLNPFNRKLRAVPFIEVCTSLGQGWKPRADEQGVDLSWFESKGFRYLVVHGNFLPPAHLPALVEYLKGRLGEPVRHDGDNLYIFTLSRQRGAFQRGDFSLY